MAKTKRPVPANLSDLAACERNPRKISERAQAGLGCSMERFGDLSGIVFNMRLGELVAGHQRVDRLREAWGDLVLETTDDHGRIVAPSGQAWGVRFVDWARPKHDAAMVAANSAAIAGEFTDDLQTLLDGVKANSPDVYDDLLFGDLAADVREDNHVLPAAELQERRTCTVSWPVADDPIIRSWLGLPAEAGLPDDLGAAIWERIRATVSSAGAARRDTRPGKEKPRRARA